jgi:thiol-disulfide isomerase/thioredoxin
MTFNRCGPCQRIAPFFDELARRYPRAVFLKVDVDNCPETAASNGVSAMPTFIFFRNKVFSP